LRDAAASEVSTSPDDRPSGYGEIALAAKLAGSKFRFGAGVRKDRNAAIEDRPVAGTRRTVQDESGSSQAMMLEAMGRLRRHVEENFDDVGDTFAKEARAIHEGKSEVRGIYGQATPTEVRDLVEDGVPVAPLPPEPPKKTELN